MGLDMFLYGANYKYDRESGAGEITFKEVAYWRKQNAIHNWFVENVQDGTDNCAMYGLDESHLKELLIACNKVLKNPTVENAMEILPTKDGFFFGGTDLNDDFEMEYYLDGLKSTVEVIREILQKNYDYYVYQSSW